MTDQRTFAPVWQDGDPTMEAIAAAVWKHCEKQHGSGIVIDDPRNIAAAAVAGIRDAARTAARQTTGQTDTITAVTLATPCDNCDHALNWHSSQANCVVAFCGCGRFRPPAPAVGQPAEAHDTDEAHPPRVRWRLEVWKDDRWTQPRPYPHDTVSIADVHRKAWLQNRPDARTRLVRETTTWTVEDER